MANILLTNATVGNASIYRWGHSPLSVQQGSVRATALDDGVVSYVIPGPGGVPSHLPKGDPRLFFAGREQGQAETVELWLEVPGELDTLTFHASGLPRDAVVIGWDGQAMQEPFWRCPGCAWMTAEWPVEGRPGLLAVRIRVPAGPFRFTNAEGLPLFLCRPKDRFPYAMLEAELRDPETLRALDGRVSVWRGGELLAVRDVLAGERARLVLPPGAVTVRAESGIEYMAETSDLRLAPGSTRHVDFPLRRRLRPEEGWIWGDQHMHCYYNDGAHAPATLMRAARGQGLHYAFLSDSPEAFVDGGSSCDKTGRFLGMPGQEVDTPFCHCCGLNVLRDLPHLPYGVRADRYPGPRQWLETIERQREANRPCLLQLNHPSHRADVMERWPLGYFRSWWVADEDPEVTVVENFDFPSWFDRLSRGRRLTGVWNTDTHDAVRYPPGSCRVGLFTHGRITPPAIIDAMRRGRAFCTRAPGALLYLEVEGKMPGDTVRGGNQLAAELRAQCAVPIQRIDLVQQGRVVHSLDGGDRRELRETFTVDRSAGQWILALLHADAPYPDNDHCGTPFDVSGVLAFTNPVYLQ
jgi:hypothetical protein